MAQEQAKFDGTLATSHEVGSIKSVQWVDVPNGLKADSAVDNFTLGEIKIVEGERVVAPATAATKKEDAVLVASVERQYLNMAPYAGLDAFYNEKGEYARAVRLTVQLQFSTSAFIGELAVGDKVAWNGTKFAAVGEDVAVDAPQFIVETAKDGLHDTGLGKDTIVLEFYK